MQVKKVFSVDPLPIHQKPPYVKPKYKTYRELLDLDRPKKIIQQESDDENDDFLEKLMKKQKRKQQEEKQKEKEKKESAKSKKKVLQAQQTQNQHLPQLHNQKKNQPLNVLAEKKKTEREASRLPSAQSRPIDLNDSVEYLEKKIETEEVGSNFNLNLKKKTTQNQEFEFEEDLDSPSLKKRQTIKVSIRKKNSSDNNLRKSHKPSSGFSKSHSNSSSDQLMEKMLKHSRTQATKIIKNGFIPSHKLRKSEGLRELQRNTHQQRPTVRNYDNLIETKLNPQKRVIQHTISPQKYVKQNQVSYAAKAKDFLFKSASSPPIQQMLMTLSPKVKNQSKYKEAMIARKSLFKSSYQEELFVKSLKKK